MNKQSHRKKQAKKDRKANKIYFIGGPHKPKEYKCIRKTIEFNLKDDGINIEVVGAKVINAKEGVIRL